jgi:hypothetical protein
MNSKTKLGKKKVIPKPGSNGFENLLNLSEVTLLDINPIKKGNNIYYKVKCNTCNKELNKASYQLGKSKCQCIKSQKPVHNFKGVGDVSSAYFERAKRGARERRNMEFSITIEDAWKQFQKQNGLCALTGLPIILDRNNTKTGRLIMTASLDRIDSGKGYIVNNIQWIHKHINLMKNNFDQKYFIDMCKLIAKNKND